MFIQFKLIFHQRSSRTLLRPSDGDRCGVVLREVQKFKLIFLEREHRPAKVRARSFYGEKRSWDNLGSR